MKNNDYNLNDEPNLPLDDNGKNPFGLPAGYFSTFEDKLKQKMELESELSEFPLLSSIQKTNVFIAPAGYFQSAENSLEHKTELAAYPNLQAIKTPVFADLTEEYKKALASSLTYKTELIEELKAYEKLYALDKTNAFSVPENYFDTVADRVKEKVYAVNHHKESVLGTVLDFIFGKKLALSFSLLLIVGLAVYFNQPDEPVIAAGDCKTLACLERQEILNDNNAISDFDEDQLMELVDVNALNKQLNANTEASTGSTIKSDKNDHNQPINLDSVNEDELLDQL
jgi:hypothetical protein